MNNPATLMTDCATSDSATVVEVRGGDVAADASQPDTVDHQLTVTTDAASPSSRVVTTEAPPMPLSSDIDGVDGVTTGKVTTSAAPNNHSSHSPAEAAASASMAMAVAADETSPPVITSQNQTNSLPLSDCPAVNDAESGKFQLKWSQHADVTRQLYWNFFENGLHTDCTMVHGEERLRAHAIILAAASPLLQAVINRGRRLSTSAADKQQQRRNNRHVTMSVNTNVRPGLLHLLLQFAYLGSIEINQADIEDFICLAEQFRMRGLIRDSCYNGNHYQTGADGIAEDGADVANIGRAGLDARVDEVVDDSVVTLLHANSSGKCHNIANICNSRTSANAINGGCIGLGGSGSISTSSNSSNEGKHKLCSRRSDSESPDDWQSSSDYFSAQASRCGSGASLVMQTSLMPPITASGKSNDTESASDAFNVDHQLHHDQQQLHMTTASATSWSSANLHQQLRNQTKGRKSCVPKKLNRGSIRRCSGSSAMISSPVDDHNNNPIDSPEAVAAAASALMAARKRAAATAAAANLKCAADFAADGDPIDLSLSSLADVQQLSASSGVVDTVIEASGQAPSKLQRVSTHISSIQRASIDQVVQASLNELRRSQASIDDAAGLASALTMQRAAAMSDADRTVATNQTEALKNKIRMMFAMTSVGDDVPDGPSSQYPTSSQANTASARRDDAMSFLNRAPTVGEQSGLVICEDDEDIAHEVVGGAGASAGGATASAGEAELAGAETRMAAAVDTVVGGRPSTSSGDATPTLSLSTPAVGNGISDARVRVSDHYELDEYGQAVIGVNGKPRVRCEQCGKTLADPSSLYRHRKTHTGEMPHTCPYLFCSRGFVQKFNMRCHTKVHRNVFMDKDLYESLEESVRENILKFNDGVPPYKFPRETEVIHAQKFSKRLGKTYKRSPNLLVDPETLEAGGNRSNGVINPAAITTTVAKSIINGNGHVASTSSTSSAAAAAAAAAETMKILSTLSAAATTSVTQPSTVTAEVETVNYPKMEVEFNPLTMLMKQQTDLSTSLSTA